MTLFVDVPFCFDGECICFSHEFGEVRFTTRKGGVSFGAYKSLNLGASVEDSQLAVAENRSILSKKFSKPVSFVHQVHGCELFVCAETPSSNQCKADGQITKSDACALAVTVADCLPAALLSESAVAIIHAGWRGLVAGILPKAVQQLVERHDAKQIVAVFGPAAQSCCYEVSEELRNRIATLEQNAVYGKTVSLPKLAHSQLTAVGIKEIFNTQLCTICCGKEWFFSHRRDQGKTGRQVGVVWMSPGTTIKQ